MSRAMMLSLQAQNNSERTLDEERVRLDKIKQIVDSIYYSAVEFAATSTDMSFKYEIPRMRYRYHDSNRGSDPFYLNNMDDILNRLQILFPDCSVTHALMARGRDGKIYDLSKIDDSVIPFIDQTLEQSYIVIDWS